MIDELESNGWVKTDNLADRVHYLENSGFSLTVIDGPLGTIIVPSGPIRGRLFGTSGFELSTDQNLMDVGNLSPGQQSIAQNSRIGGGIGSRIEFFGNNQQTQNNNNSSDTESEESNTTNNQNSSGEPEQPQRKNARTSGAGDFV